MQGQNKEVLQINDEGIIFMDYLPCDYTTLINLIAGNNCVLIFDTEEAYNNLQREIAKFVRKVCSIELGEKIIKFIAEEYSQQVEILSFISYD